MSRSGRNLQGPSGGGQFHCDYCRRDISGPSLGTPFDQVDAATYIRIRCAVCNNFDLCLDCFANGVEIYPHLKTHPYTIQRPHTDHIFENGWQADEELLLLEGIEIYGFGNWYDISEYIGTKSALRCEYHYNRLYIDSKACPEPDMTLPLLPAIQLSVEDDETPLQRLAGVGGGSSKSMTKKNSKNQQRKNGGVKSGSSQLIRAGSNASISSAISATTYSNILPNGQIPSSQGLKKPTWLPSILKPKTGIASIIGLTPNRLDFDVEYDNSAEELVAEIVFEENDSEIEIERKLTLMEIYNQTLDARLERKTLIFQRHLLQEYDKQTAILNHNNGKKRSPAELEYERQYKLFLRFLPSTTEYDKFLASMTKELLVRDEIHLYHQYRRLGLHTFTDVQRYELEQRRLRMSEKLSGSSEQSQQQMNGMVNGMMTSNGGGTDVYDSIFNTSSSTTGKSKKGKHAHQTSNLLDDTDPTGMSSTFGSDVSLNQFANDFSTSNGGKINPNDKFVDSDGSLPTPTPSPLHHSTNPHKPPKTLFDVSVMPGSELLSTAEQSLCTDLHLIPKHYMILKDKMFRCYMTKGHLTPKNVRAAIPRVEFKLLTKVLEYLLSTGWVSQVPQTPDSALQVEQQLQERITTTVKAEPQSTPTMASVIPTNNNNTSTPKQPKPRKNNPNTTNKRSTPTQPKKAAVKAEVQPHPMQITQPPLS